MEVFTPHPIRKYTMLHDSFSMAEEMFKQHAFESLITNANRLFSEAYSYTLYVPILSIVNCHLHKWGRPCGIPGVWYRIFENPRGLLVFPFHMVH